MQYMDRIQPNEKFCRYQWQLVAICCLIVSAKYNECEEHVPSLRSFVNIINHPIPKEVELQYELWLLKQIGWRLNGNTPTYLRSDWLTVYVRPHGFK